jgi:hypothetical protein
VAIASSCTSCRYCGSRNSIPLNTKYAANNMIAPVETTERDRMRTSNSGARDLNSRITNATLTATPPSSAPRTAGESAEHKQTGERDRVRVDHPLELARGRVELTADERQRDVGDRDVDRSGERAAAEHSERDRALVVVDLYRRLVIVRMSRPSCTRER